MADPVPVKKKVFSRENILEKQKAQQEEHAQKVDELRKAFDRIANTPDGLKLFQYLFLLCNGDKPSIRRDGKGKIDMEDTLATLGAKSVYENLRFNLSSDTLKKIERHNWET